MAPLGYNACRILWALRAVAALYSSFGFLKAIKFHGSFAYSFGLLASSVLGGEAGISSGATHAHDFTLEY